MRLVYFVSPYELLDVSESRAVSLSLATEKSREFGHHVQITIEATTEQHKLQLTTLMQVAKGVDGKK